MKQVLTFNQKRIIMIELQKNRVPAPTGGRMPCTGRLVDLRHVVYLNCGYRKKEEADGNREADSELSEAQEKLLLEFIHDFCVGNPGDPREMIHTSFRERALEITRKDEKGVSTLDTAFEKFIAEEREEAYKAGRKEEHEEVQMTNIVNMLKNNVSVENIATYLRVTEEEVQRIKRMLDL